MTPAARVATAAELLDEVFNGAPAERALTSWARRSRFAGSRDRAAIRDLVFDGLRCRTSFGWLGGGVDGRAVMLGRAISHDVDPSTLFTGDRYALAPPTERELHGPGDLDTAPRHIRLDVPEWTLETLDGSFGTQTDAVLDALRSRAPVTLRVNTAKATKSEITELLTSNGFDAVSHALALNAIRVDGDTRGLVRLEAYENGLFEFQDAASQAAVERLADIWQGASVLDYCAGGGGKALAISAAGADRIVAHDANLARMKDLPVRAKRAGAVIEVATTPEGVFDVVLCDVPCSGSGAWRRQPEAKWRLSPEAFRDFQETQSNIIDTAKRHVAAGGRFIYMTCSLFAEENAVQISNALKRHSDLTEVSQHQFTPLDGGDGFFVAVFSVQDAFG